MNNQSKSKKHYVVLAALAIMSSLSLASCHHHKNVWMPRPAYGPGYNAPGYGGGYGKGYRPAPAPYRAPAAHPAPRPGYYGPYR